MRLGPTIMNKTTIELYRQGGSIYGYGFVGGWPMTGESDVLEGLMAWTRKTANRRKRVYRHFVRTAHENPSCTMWHYMREYGDNLTRQQGKAVFKDQPPDVVVFDGCRRIPMAEAVTYLDIYWQ